MNKGLKITVNILVLLLIAGFGYYMISTVMSDEKTIPAAADDLESGFVSPYKKTGSFDAASDIICFYIYEEKIYAVLADRVSIFDLSGSHLNDFGIETGVRDIAADDTGVYLLYPAGIDVYTLAGEAGGGWRSCSDNADYCALTTSREYVFVTDATHKHITQYNKEGGLIRFIRSPEGFIIPSYTFDIININDTIYCANSGRHRIESYTLDGRFISSFGKSGAQAGAFAGCCNPVYLAQSPDGHILTSEKGNPRISCYSRDGKFRTILFDSHALGGGTSAYEMHVSGKKIYIASKRTISVYTFDPALSAGSCAGCTAVCPLRK
ncbi:MAG: hypothetical protein FWE10_02400 [Rikenellaceae bacterium]|nr:hypothetical protein [Rikenellaceae bacterium]MCL2692725.1 hypothetical protein [Rikenellaceae bacterium]